MKWSRRINLIARDTPEAQAIENHFLDSLTLLPLLQNAGAHLLDVGTGGGFPGLVLACALPEFGSPWWSRARSGSYFSVM